jgi:hypothetical protein
LRLLTRIEWKPFCDRISKALSGDSVELEVVSLSLGDRFASRWVPLVGITYDPRADVLEIALPDLDHTIEHPQAVWVDETRRGIVAIEVTTGEARDEILRLREPLALPPAAEPKGES